MQFALVLLSTVLALLILNDIIVMLELKQLRQRLEEIAKYQCWRAQQTKQHTVWSSPITTRWVEPSGTYSSGGEIVDESSKNEQL